MFVTVGHTIVYALRGLNASLLICRAGVDAPHKQFQTLCFNTTEAHGEYQCS